MKELLFSNSLRSNENNLIYFRKQLGNKEKRKISASRAVFSCNMLRGNKVNNISFVNISLSLQSLFMTRVKFMVAATLGKNLGSPVPKWSNGQ